MNDTPAMMLQMTSVPSDWTCMGLRLAGRQWAWDLILGMGFQVEWRDPKDSVDAKSTVSLGEDGDSG